MDIRADEISRIIREQIKDSGKKVDVAETGTVLSQGDGIARIFGLSGAAAAALALGSRARHGRHHVPPRVPVRRPPPRAPPRASRHEAWRVER